MTFYETGLHPSLLPLKKAIYSDDKGDVGLGSIVSIGYQ